MTRQEIEYRKARSSGPIMLAEMQKWPYERKLLHTKRVIEGFIEAVTGDQLGREYKWVWPDDPNDPDYADGRMEMADGKPPYSTHISVGGLDSITLLCLIRSMGYGPERVPAISVSSLEDASIQRIHKQLGIIPLKPYKSKVQVLNEVGFPVISKDKAGKIEAICCPTPKNKTVRHAIMTGDTGKQGGYRTGTRMQLPLKWRKLFCGPANAEYGTEYLTAPFKVSNKCCYYMKEKPCDDWARERNSYPFLGLMASEGGQREKALNKNGCNYYSPGTVRSAPFAIFTRQDLLRLVIDLDVMVPEIYGEIKQRPDGTLYTTRAQRTGCTMCGFGIHIENRPHRFDRLREDNPKEWHFWMYDCVTDPETGEKYGWGRVLDWIGVGWEDDPYGNVSGQLDMFGGEAI